MRHIDELKAMHLRELYRRMGWFAGIAVRVAYMRLSPEQRSNVAQYASQLRDYMEQQGDGPVDQVLLEMACLMPGAMRSKPSYMADQSPVTRPMYASELREARDWLLQADKLAATLRTLTPEQWNLLLPDAAADQRLVEPPSTSSHLVLEILDLVLPEVAEDA